jgi:hypothetical protein
MRDYAQEIRRAQGQRAVRERMNKKKPKVRRPSNLDPKPLELFPGKCGCYAGFGCWRNCSCSHCHPHRYGGSS